MNKLNQKGDCWSFTETDPDSQWYGRQYRFDFSYIRSKKLREQFKYYIWKNYRAGDKMPATLRQELSWFRYYEAWLYECGIEALEQIAAAEAEGFLSFLHLCISDKTKRPLRLITQKHIYDTVRAIYRWYAWRQPEFLAAAELFPGNVYQRINRIRRQQEVPAETAELFMKALKQNDNPCLRCGGKILAATGIAPGDMLGLKIDCLQKSSGGVSLQYYHHRKKAYRRIPVGAGCLEAVKELEAQTAELRRYAPEDVKQRLFLHCGKWDQVIVPDMNLFRYWLRRLMEHEENGGTPTCTQLRYACAQDMLSVMQPLAVQELTGVALMSSGEGRCGAWQL